jgi:hypothetical protein
MVSLLFVEMGCSVSFLILRQPLDELSLSLLLFLQLSCQKLQSHHCLPLGLQIDRVWLYAEGELGRAVFRRVVLTEGGRGGQFGDDLVEGGCALGNGLTVGAVGGHRHHFGEDGETDWLPILRAEGIV